MMWKKTDVSYPQPETPAPTPAPTEQLRDRAVIGASIVIKGDISGDEDLLVQGQVEGQIQLKKHNVTIGKHGRVKADIYGKVISIEGDVQGNVYGDEKIVIRAAGKLQGNMVAPRVTLEDGSKFKGAIDMDAKRETQATGSAGASSSPNAAKTPNGREESGGSGKKQPSLPHQTGSASKA